MCPDSISGELALVYCVPRELIQADRISKAQPCIHWIFFYSLEQRSAISVTLDLSDALVSAEVAILGCKLKRIGYLDKKGN